jgi:hypothetical protein
MVFTAGLTTVMFVVFGLVTGLLPVYLLYLYIAWLGWFAGVATVYLSNRYTRSRSQDDEI